MYRVIVSIVFVAFFTTACGDKNYTCSGFDFDLNRSLVSILMFPDKAETYSFASKSDTLELVKDWISITEPYTYDCAALIRVFVPPCTCMNSYDEHYFLKVDPQTHFDSRIDFYQDKGEDARRSIAYLTYGANFHLDYTETLVEDLTIDKITIEDTDYTNVIDFKLDRNSPSNEGFVISRVIIQPNVGLVGFTLNDDYYKIIPN